MSVNNLKILARCYNMGDHLTMSVGAMTPTAPERAAWEKLLTGLLPQVSRSFYLTIRVLPADLRRPVGLAYLLARAADTIADTRALPPAQRLERLLSFRAVLEESAPSKSVGEMARDLTDFQKSEAEGELISSLDDALRRLESTPQEDRRLIRSVVVNLTRGMEMDLTVFPPEEAGAVGSLETEEDLDQYTYHVAGCVGEFWTAITMSHTPALRKWDLEKMSKAGVRFGKALQLTNVLRDIPRDLRIGRCYLPETRLSQLGLRPDDLLDPSVAPAARPALAWGIERALEHYREAVGYILAIPRGSLRLRLAVLWPVIIGIATLGKLAQNRDWLNPEVITKVSRRWVYSVMAASLPAARSDTLVKMWTATLAARVRSAL